MRGLRWLVLGVVILFAGVGVLGAQAPSVTLVQRAVLPAASYIDGPKSGVGIGDKPINNVKAPFANQPIGSVSAFVRGWFKNTWALLTDKGFGSSPASDHLLRVYLVEIDWLSAQGGKGTVSVLDWITLADPRKLAGAITLANTAERQLTGADFNPNSIARLADKTLWVGDTNGSLVHFSLDGALLAAPRKLSGNIRALSTTTDFKRLVVVTQNGGALAITVLDPATGAAVGNPAAYGLDSPSNQVTDLIMISGTQALVSEQDSALGSGAKTKLIYLVNITNGSKQLVADLLNISDPAKLGVNAAFGPSSGKFGLSNPFRFPLDVSAVYPVDATTIAVVNNNQFPYSAARQGGVADATEFIAIRIGTPLALELKELQNDR